MLQSVRVAAGAWLQSTTGNLGKKVKSTKSFFSRWHVAASGYESLQMAASDCFFEDQNDARLLALWKYWLPFPLFSNIAPSKARCLRVETRWKRQSCSCCRLIVCLVMSCDVLWSLVRSVNGTSSSSFLRFDRFGEPLSMLMFGRRCLRQWSCSFAWSWPSSSLACSLHSWTMPTSMVSNICKATPG